MDINSFSLDQEYFGFNHYKRSAKSNLDFMYFTSIEDSEQYKKLLRDYKEAVENINESGLSQSDLDKRLKEEKKRFDREAAKIKGQQVVESAGKAASVIDNIFSKATSALGIGTTDKINTNQKAPINVSYSSSSSKTKRTGLIIAGVLVVAGIGFWAYKKMKS